MNKKLNYLPTHDHFYGYAATNKQILYSIVEKINKIPTKKDAKNAAWPNILEEAETTAYKSLDIKEGKMLVEYSVRPKDYLETPPERRARFTKNKTKKLESWKIQNLEFERAENKKWWDIYFTFSQPIFQNRVYAVSSGEGAITLKENTYNPNKESKEITREFDKEEVLEFIKQFQSKSNQDSYTHHFKVKNARNTIQKIKPLLNRELYYHKEHFGEKQYYFVEYKTSLEEMNVEEIIRQIKGRQCNGYKVLCSFDERIEKYRPLLKNENIKLVILGGKTRQKIKKKFSKEKNGNLKRFTNEGNK